MLNSVGDRIIEILYEDTECAVVKNGQITDWFAVRIGVRQGCLLTILGSTLIAIIFQRAFLQTVSNAALKSTKLKWRGTLWSLAISMTCLAMKVASTVPRPCLKPNWLFFIDASVLAFILFSNIRLKTFPDIDSKDIAR